MRTLNRRQLLQLGSLSAGLAVPGVALGAAPAFAAGEDDRRVRLSGDGLGLTPLEYAALLHRLIDEKGIVPDSYSLGGIVEELEQAVRARARQGARDLHAHRHAREPHGGARARRRVEPRDRPGRKPPLSGRRRLRADAQQPDADAAGGGPRDVHGRRAAARARRRPKARASSRACRRFRSRRRSAASRASGSTRRSSKKIIAIARRDGIRLHLDGARLFLEAAYSGRERRRLLEAVRHGLRLALQVLQRRVGRDSRRPARAHRRHVSHGGGCSAAASITSWPFALVALHYLAGFGDRFGQRRTGVRGLDPRAPAERALRDRSRPARHEPVPAAGARAPIRPRSASASRSAGVLVGAPQDGRFLIGVNETLNRTTAAGADRCVRAGAPGVGSFHRQGMNVRSGGAEIRRFSF